MKDFPQEEISHDIPEQELNEAFGSGNWKRMPDEIFWQLRFEPGPDGSRRNMSSKCMSERMGHIRTNSSVEIIRKPYLSAANERRCIWRGASGLTFTNKVHGKCTLTCHNDNCENIIEVC